MKITHYTSNDFKTSNWSGGTTTQLYIAPTTANYADLNFDIRISSAKVAVEKSTFTNLPKVNRQLMILDGAITISHQDRYTKQLQPLDVDTFQGDWNTTSEGVCTDFNVMTIGNAVTNLSGLDITTNQQELVNIDKWNTFFVYLFTGELSITIGDKNYIMNSDNLLVIDAENLLEIEILAKQNSRLAMVGYNPI